MATSGRKKFLTLFSIFIVVLLCAGLAWYYFSSSDAHKGTNLGVKNIKYEIPELEYLVSIDEEIEVPVNHLMVLLTEESSSSDIDKVAELVKGEVVGEFEYIKLYQIKTDSETLEELDAYVEKTKEHNSVEYVGYHMPSSSKKTIEGIPCKLLEDVYENKDYANPYEMIGLEKAWQYIHASGVKLSKVRVGVTDTGLHAESSDGDAGTKIRVLGKDDEQKSNTQYNSHGTMVSNVLGAGWQNSGMRGVAGGLDENLEVYVSSLSKNSQSYVQISDEDYDPDDPTHTRHGNKSYLVSNLHEIMKQIEDGAQIINYSWGSTKPENSNNFTNQVYRRFLQKMQEDNPKVVFVAAAGNEARIRVKNEETDEYEWVDGNKLDGSNYDMGGTPMDNLITVGSLDADGNVSNFSNRTTGDGEVTITAQGRAVPVGFNQDGTVRTANGTSFATPQVAGAVAILKSLNPELTAIEIKNILQDSADTSFKDVDIPADSSGKVMRLDKAVLKVLSDILGEEIDAEKLLAVATITSVAKQNSDDDMNYTITANLPEVRKTPVTVGLSFSGQGALGGKAKRSVSSATDIEWDWTFLSNDNSVYITITRQDSNACTRLYIEPSDFAGVYEGAISVAFPDFEYFINDFTTTGEGTRNVDVPVKITINDQGDATFSFRTKGNIDFSAPGFPMSMDYDSVGDIPGSIDAKGNLIFEGDYTGSYKMNLPEIYASIMPGDYMANTSGQMTGSCNANGLLDKEVINGKVNFISAEGHTSSANYRAVKVE